MLRGGIAEQNGLALAAEQRARDTLRSRARVGRQRRGDALDFGDSRGHLRQRIRPTTRCRRETGRHGHGPVVMHRMQAVQLAATAHGMAQTQCEQRMVLAKERADHEGALQVRQRSNGGAEPARMARCCPVCEIRMADAVVDVLAAQAAHQLGEQVQFFDGGVGRTQGADGAGAELALNPLHAISHIAQRGVPVHRLPDATLLDHRLRQTLRSVQGLVGETVAVRDPALIDGLNLQRQHAHYLVGLDLHDQVGAGAVVRAHALAP